MMAIQVVVQGFRFVGAARRAAFDGEYYRQSAVKALAEEHKKATGDAKLPRGGYPDMGSGRYSAHLSYGQWYAFNNAQRGEWRCRCPIAAILHHLSRRS